MKRIQLGSLAAVILIVGFWVLWRTPGGPGPRMALEAGAASHATERTGPSMLDAAEGGLAAPEGADEVRRALASTDALGVGFERGRVALQLRSTATGAPASGARVLFGDAGFWETLGVVQGLLLGSGELPGAWRASAAVFKADAEGRVEIPLPRGLALVAAERGPERGFYMLSSPRLGSDLWSTAAATVWLERPRDLELNFVDQSGAPRANFTFAVVPRAFYLREPWVSGVADSHGRAWLHHFHTLLPKIGAQRELEISSRDARGVWDVVPLDPSAQPLDAWGAPLPLTVVVPRGADLQVQVVDPLGQPLHDRSFKLHVEVEHGDESVGFSRTLDGVSEIWLRDLPANERFWVASRTRKYGEPWAFEGAVTGETPGVGEARSIVLTCTEEPPARVLVGGRLIFPEDIKPLDSVLSLKVHVDAPGPGAGGNFGPTEVRGEADSGERHQDLYRRGQAQEDGAFEVTLDGLAAELAKSRSLFLGLELVSSGEHGEILRAVLPMECRSVHAGRIDLGRIQLERMGILCRGQVVDQEGRPVSGAGLTADSRARGSAERLMLAERGVSDALGNFVVRGVQSEAGLFVRAKCPGYRSTEWLEVIDPSLPVRLELSGAGAIAGRLLLEEGQDSGIFEVGIARENGEASSVDWTRLDEESGRFDWQELEPGRYTVQVRLSATREALVTVPGVDVVAGETTHDARLAAIRMQGVARTIKLTILGRDDEPVTHATISMSRDGIDLGKTWYWEGHERIYVGELPVTLWVTASGYVPTRFDVADGSAVLRLQPGIAARARLATPVTLPPFGEIDWSLYPLDEFPGLASDRADSRVIFDGTGQIEDVQFAVPGRWGAWLNLEVVKGDSANWAPLGSHPDPWIFNVPAGGSVATFVIPVTQAEVDAAWAEIQADE